MNIPVLSKRHRLFEFPKAGFGEMAGDDLSFMSPAKAVLMLLQAFVVVMDDMPLTMMSMAGQAAVFVMLVPDHDVKVL